MAEVWSLVLWLVNAGDNAWNEPDEAQDEQRPAGHRSRVFNAPALERAHYGHFEDRDEAERALENLQEKLDDGESVIVRNQNHTFLIPASSILYVAMGPGEAEQVIEAEGKQSKTPPHG